MNDLQQILEMWKKDSVINDMALDESSRDSAKLHGKYLEILSVNKMKLKKAELEFSSTAQEVNYLTTEINFSYTNFEFE